MLHRRVAAHGDVEDVVFGSAARTSNARTAGAGATSPSQSFASTSARATGASERGAISASQSRRGFRRQARRHFPPGPTTVSPSSRASPRMSRTVQEPQAPRPPQAPRRRTPWRRAA
jgi:hypothetical protein